MFKLNFFLCLLCLLLCSSAILARSSWVKSKDVSEKINLFDSSKAHENQAVGDKVFEDTPVYRGASEKAETWGEIESGTALIVLSEKTYKGFYKVLYEGRVGYVPEGVFSFKDDEHESEEKKDEEHVSKEKKDDEHEHAHETPSPRVSPTHKITRRPTLRPTRRPTAVPTRVKSKEKIAARPSVHLSKKARARLAKKRNTSSWRDRHSSRQVVSRHYASRPRHTGGGASYVSNGETLHFFPMSRRQRPLLYLYLGGAKGKEARAKVPFITDTERDYGSLSPIGRMALLGVDVRVNRFARIFVDFSTHQYIRLVGRKDVLSSSEWLKTVAPATAPPGSKFGYLVNPLNENMYMVMDTKASRLGLKLGLPLGQVVEPWVGGALGAYDYNLNIGDRAAELSIGEGSGTAWGVNWSVGIDFKIPARRFYWTITAFLEGGSPTPSIDTRIDLGSEGIQTWSANNDVVAPMRPGLALGIAF